MGVICDTCIWIGIETGRLRQSAVADLAGGQPVYLTPVTIAELHHGAMVAPNPRERRKRLRALESLRAKPCLPIDRDTGEVFGSVLAMLRQAGGSSRKKIQDVWIASVALQNEMPVMTSNSADFDNIPGLKVLPAPV